MKVNSVVLLVMLLLVAAAGWFAASTAGPKMATLLMGVAIGVIISMPLTLLVARVLWSDQLRTMRRERRKGHYQPLSSVEYPPVIVVPSPAREASDSGGQTYQRASWDSVPPVIRYLGED